MTNKELQVASDASTDGGGQDVQLYFTCLTANKTIHIERFSTVDIKCHVICQNEF